MKERGIIFSAPMVRAILEGRKTQTRRIVKPQPPSWSVGLQIVPHDTNRIPDGCYWALVLPTGTSNKDSPPQHGWRMCHYGAPGGRLWVRETWYDDNALRISEPRPTAADNCIYYRADGEPQWEADSSTPWRPSIHMPRWASRITLEVTEVRVQRLQDISEDDARAEGVEPVTMDDYAFKWRGGFQRIWEQIHGLDSWMENPWIWALTFRRLEA